MLRNALLLALVSLIVTSCSSGAGDGGSPGDDGGSDAGSTPDSGAADAGKADGGAPDSGSPDAGTPDAGLVDAGPEELLSARPGEWPTFKRDLAHTGLVEPSQMRGAITAANRCVKWEKQIAGDNTRGASGALIATVAGVPTVFFVVDCPIDGGCPLDGGGAGAAWALRGSDGGTLWRTQLPGATRSDPYAPTLADVDGDGKRELVFASNNTNHVFSLRTEDEGTHPAGSVEWSYAFDTDARSEGAPVVVNLDPSDPTPEIILGTDFDPVVGATGSKVLVIDGRTGTLDGEAFVAPGRTAAGCPAGRKTDSSSPTVGFVGGSWKVYVGDWNGSFFALEWRTSPTPGLYQAWRNPLPAFDGGCPVMKVRSGATLGPIIPDAGLQLAFGYMAETSGLDQYKTARLRIVQAEGLATVFDLPDVWDWKSTPSAADLDPAAPGLEITGGRYLGHYAVKQTAPGAFVEAWNPTRGDGQGFWGGNRTSPAVADLDGDGGLEVVMGTEGSVLPGLAVYNGKTGQLVWEYALPGTGMDSSPAIGDLDGDGQLEIVFLARNGVAYAIDSSCP